MHLRLVSKRLADGQVRRYAQLVRSYRRPDGMPAHEIVGTLGSLSDQEIENIRRALKASRAGQVVLLPAEAAPEDWQLKVVANLDYLDVAVALSTWDYWKLSELFNRLLPRGAELVPTSQIILPLVLQRCIAPGSKLYAQRWYPTTALPELTGVSPDHFNNSRIHRALEDLDRVDAQLQQELPKRYEQRDGAFAALFLDVSDTYFQGRGCDMAQRDRTKEGLRNVHKIGIVLLCNQQGYPLRWQVVPGKRRDPQCMSEMVEAVEELEWVRDVPFVCDRAMGHAAAVARLVSSRLRFLTATRVTEIASYTEDLPSEAFESLMPEATDITTDQDVEGARAAAENAGLEKVDDTLFVKDLGVRTRTLFVDCAPIEVRDAEYDPTRLKGGAAFLALARILRRKLEAKEAKNQAALARDHELTRARMTQIFTLLRLDPTIQERILRGDFGHLPEKVLRKAALRGGAILQREFLEKHARKHEETGKPFRRTGAQEVELRLVAYFNPEMFVEQRARAIRRRTEVEAYVQTLNQALLTRDRSREDVYRDVLNKLHGNNVVGLYTVNVEPTEVAAGNTRVQVRLEADEREWKRRRRFDGFVLLIAHPELPMNATELVRLYRAKDAVEKDFRTIKEVIKLRPVFHFTDPKVRAHVTLCMLALLLERSLEHRLRRSSTPMTTPACFELLRSCHLNLLRASPDGPIRYSLTSPTPEQKALVTNLRVTAFIDEEMVQGRLSPRNC